MKKQYYENLEQSMMEALQKYLPRIVQCGADLLKNNHKQTAEALKSQTKSAPNCSCGLVGPNCREPA